MVEYQSKLYIFGGIQPNSTSPSSTIYLFDLLTREWQILTPNGEDKPLGRMFHSAAIKNDDSGNPEAMVVYGGINCHTRVIITTEEKAVAYYTFSANAIEYQNAMEDIWFFGFTDQVWIEMKTVRTKRRGDCPQAENVKVIGGTDTNTPPQRGTHGGWRDKQRRGRVIDLSDPRTLDTMEDSVDDLPPELQQDYERDPVEEARKMAADAKKSAENTKNSGHGRTLLSSVAHSLGDSFSQWWPW